MTRQIFVWSATHDLSGFFFMLTTVATIMNPLNSQYTYLAPMAASLLVGRRQLLQANKCCDGANALANAIDGNAAALAAAGGQTAITTLNQVFAECDSVDGVSTNDLAAFDAIVTSLLPVVATIDNAFYTNVLSVLTGDLSSAAGEHLKCHIVCQTGCVHVAAIAC